MRCWIAVASADHVRFGRASGFLQAGHGAAEPLRRIASGDCVACYSPTARFRGTERLAAFTAIGIVKAGDPYRAEMGDGFRPYRRDVRWLDSDVAPIRPMLDRLAFTRGNARWGYRLRLGLFEISAGDMRAIADAMSATLPPQRGASSRLNRSTAKSTNARTRPLARRPAMCTTWIGSGGSSKSASTISSAPARSCGAT
jgi:hypothetical protein